MQRQNWLVAGLTAFVLVAGGSTRAGATDSLLESIQSVPGELAARWWMWAEESDFVQFAPGEVDCRAEQHGLVWFLAGTFGGAEERECTVSRNRALFFPVVNSIWNNLPGDLPEFVLTVEEKREVLDGVLGGGPSDVLVLLLGEDRFQACNMYARIDGRPIVFDTPIVRAQSPAFSFADDPQAVTDGFWVLLPPLRRGDYELEFGGAWCAQDGTPIFSTDLSLLLHVR